MSHPLFEIVTTTAGAISIRNKAVNEIMHNPVGPWAEANALYIRQSDLALRLSETGEGPLVVFDVGMGAAANSLATLACFRAQARSRRPLRMISFERDLELLRFALEHADAFEHFRGCEPALQEILDHGKWVEDGVEWILRPGDFLERIESETERPHLVFYDPYSPKVNSEMWTTACFEKIHRCARGPEEGATLLFTYSQATRIRAALLKAGFHVGYGEPTGLKEETTIASTDFARLKNPFGEKWFTRWSHSHIRYPYDCVPEREAEFDAFMAHYRGQFSSPKMATKLLR